MSKLLKSKIGYFISGIYLLVTLPAIAAVAVFFILRYYNGNVDVHPIEDPISVGTVVLTLPWSIIATILGIIVQGGHGMHTGRFVIVVGLVVGALINASIFYLLGYWFSKAFTYFSAAEKP